MHRLLVLLLLAPLLGSSAAASASASTTAAAASVVVAAPAARSALPRKARWQADVRRAMRGSSAALRDRVADTSPGERLALNLDIDNTTLMSHYHRGAPVRRVLRLVRYADRLGVGILFNTGRHPSRAERTRVQLESAGFPVDLLCTRLEDEPLVTGKQRCRDDFAAAGWTVVFNVGNRSTDFAGDGYERAWRLPDYGLRLD